MGRSLRTLRVRVLRFLAVAIAVTVVPFGIGDAARVPNLYQVTVTPEAPGSEQRAEASRLAMAQLLVRVTGKREAAFDPALAGLLQEPDPYVSSYGRDLQGRPVVGFAASLVEQALTSLNYSFWGPERPLTLLWIAVDNGVGERALLGANEGTADTSPEMAMLTTALKEEAEAVELERGLPIALPLLDLEDLTAVTFTDVWGNFEEPIERASARYQPDAILVGRVRPGLFGNEVQCMLLRNGVRRAVSGMSLRDCLDAAADIYAADYAVIGGSSTTRITVTDVGSLGDYGRVVSYLETLSVLQSVDIESLDGGVLTVRVAARGDDQVLERVLTLGGVLRPAPGGLGAQAGGLVFTVAPRDGGQ